jgi:hypothetical protein
MIPSPSRGAANATTRCSLIGLASFALPIYVSLRGSPERDRSNPRLSSLRGGRSLPDEAISNMTYAVGERTGCLGGFRPPKHPQFSLNCVNSYI